MVTAESLTTAQLTDWRDAQSNPIARCWGDVALGHRVFPYSTAAEARQRIAQDINARRGANP